MRAATRSKLAILTSRSGLMMSYDFPVELYLDMPLIFLHSRDG